MKNNNIIKMMLLVVAFLTISSSIYSQTYDENYLDGRVFFKLKNDQIVKLKSQRSVDLSELPDVRKVLEGFSITEIERPNWDFNDKNLIRTFRVIFSNYSEVNQIIKVLEKMPMVEYAEKEPLYKAFWAPNDPYYNDNINGAGNYGWRWFYDLVNSEGAWQVSQNQIGTVGSSNVKIAVVDNAVYTSHPDLDVYLQRDVADNDNDASPPTNSFEWSHGTHCSGLATATTNNATGMASLGADAQLIAVKCTRNSSGAGYVEYSYDGVSWAISNGADVISMSFGGTSQSTTFQNLITNAYNNGIVCIAAAGNDGVTTKNYPGAYTHVICVGSVDSDDSRSSFSNYNGATTWVDIASPGGSNASTNVGLLSTTACDASYDVSSEGAFDITPYGPTGKYHIMSGTSMATPFATGLCGLMLAVDPTLTPDQVESCLISSGTVINQNIGPRIDAQAAMNCVVASLSNPPISDFTADYTTIAVGGTVNFTDLSSPAATAWSWTFNGGSANSTTIQNPSVTYNVAGDYDVTLVASNGYGTGSTMTKTQYIHVTSAATSCDTISHFYGTPAIYSAGTHGYIGGTNDYGDLAKADFFRASEVAAFDNISEVQVYFGIATDAGSTDSIALAIWDDNGGLPNSILASTKVALSDIVTDVNNGDPTIFSFNNEVAIPGDFYAGILLPQGNGDTVVIISNSIGDSPTGSTAFEQWSDNSWYDMQDAWTGLDSTSFAIFPVACPDATAPVADFSGTPTSICQGATVSFSDASTNTPTSWSWDFGDGVGTSNLQNPSYTYTTSGTYTVSLTVSNSGGSDTQTQTDYITVDPSTTISTQPSTQTVCAGENVTFSVVATGSNLSYQWKKGT
ncbi:MAG: S8 family serine peptidase, partial [Bacteroidales bacterium]|nr:S8 family serine peptidase [Bacteroidales bacterium]